MDVRTETAALIVAAGSGSRAGGEIPKQYRTIAGRPLLRHAVEAVRRAGIERVQVVIGDGQGDAYRAAVGDLPLLRPVNGGSTRQQSVRNGLSALANLGGAETVLIHDAARPFLPVAVVERLRIALQHSDAAVPVLPVVDTLAQADTELGETVPRFGLVRVQTPQAFRFDAIVAAHSAWNGEEATDDAQVARAAGLSVAMVGGDAQLEKLTHEEDFRRAERWIEAALAPCTGFGFDVHAFGPGDGVWIGGIRIPHSKGLIGHSDADVLLHALTDALLGAIGGGDIGEHFSPQDPQWRNAPSSLFLEHARHLIERSGGILIHVDATLICESPRLAPYRDAVRERVAELLRLPLRRVSIKATTTEKLGFTGRGEGIAAQAVATVRLPEDL